FFVGLPIPLAAGMIVSLVIAHHGMSGGPLPDGARVPVAIVTAGLSVLMVSTIRYRTFKDLKFSKMSATIFMILSAGIVLIATQLHPAFVLVAYFGLYLVLGFIESGVLLRNHWISRRVASTAGAESALDEEDEETAEEEGVVDEEDFL